MPTEASAPYIGRSWYSVLQPPVVNLLDRSRLRLGDFVEQTSKAFIDGYNGIQDAVSRYIHHATPRTVTGTESLDLESQPVNDQRVMETEQEPGIITGATTRNHNNHFTPEADYPGGPGQPASVGEHDPSETPIARPGRTWVWVTSLIVGLFLLIMVPGLILGVVTRQVAWGIAISGAVAPAVVFFGGLYYHHNR